MALTAKTFLVANNLGDLETLIAEAIGNDLFPSGDVFEADGQYVQAMVDSLPAASFEDLDSRVTALEDDTTDADAASALDLRVDALEQGDYEAVAVTATADGLTTGLIPATANYVVVTSDNADKQISLPAATVGKEMDIYVTGAACELISAVAAHKVNNVVVGATNEAALVQDALYHCKYVATNTWIVTGETKLGARIAAIVPDAL